MAATISSQLKLDMLNFIMDNNYYHEVTWYSTWQKFYQYYFESKLVQPEYSANEFRKIFLEDVMPSVKLLQLDSKKRLLLQNFMRSNRFNVTENGFVLIHAIKTEDLSSKETEIESDTETEDESDEETINESDPSGKSKTQKNMKTNDIFDMLSHGYPHWENMDKLTDYLQENEIDPKHKIFLTLFVQNESEILDNFPLKEIIERLKENRLDYLTMEPNEIIDIYMQVLQHSIEYTAISQKLYKYFGEFLQNCKKKYH